MMLFLSLFVMMWSTPTFCPSVISSNNIPFSITSPGRYLVTDNVSYTAAASTPAITITTSNVVLDMLNYTVTQVGGFGFSVTGIQVTQGVANVRIINGLVNNCTQAGISVASGCSNISVNDVSVTNCGNRGIEFIGTAASPILEAEIINCSLLMNCTVATADNALTLSNVSYTIVQDTIIDQNGSAVITGTFACIRTTGMRNQLLNVTMNDDLGNTDARGISLDNAMQTLVRSCLVNNLTAAGGGAVTAGYLCEANTTATGNIFQACIARSCIATLTVDGFLSSTNSDDNLFENCYAVLNNATATNSASHGFRAVNNNRNNFIGCKALRNTSGSTTPTPLYGVYGFKMDTTASVSVIKCLAEDNFSSSRGIGFALVGPNSNNCFLTCVAARNQTSGFDCIMSQAAFANQAFVQNLGVANTAGNQFVTGGAVSGFPTNAKNDNNTPQTVNQANAGAWTNFGVT